MASKFMHTSLILSTLAELGKQQQLPPEFKLSE